MKKSVLLIIALILCLSAFGCAQKKPSGQTTTEPTVTTPPAVITTPAATTDQKPDDLPDPTYPDWVNNEGYKVVSSSVTNVLVTEDGAKTEYPARIMILKNESKTPVMYFDVIASDNTVLCSDIWRGYCQMYMNNEGKLIVFRMIVRGDGSGDVAVEYYEVSDQKMSGYNVIELDRPDINGVVGEGHSLSFSIGSVETLLMYSQLYKTLGFRLVDAIWQEKNKALYMIADCYIDPENPTTYSYDEKAPTPDFEDNNIMGKYELEYVSRLYE